MKKFSICMITLMIANLSFASVDKKILANKSFACQERNGKEKRISFQIKFDKKGEPLVSEELCFGGEDLLVENTKYHTIITCGDDGNKITSLEQIYGKHTLKDSACAYDKKANIDWDSTNGIQGTSYTNMSSGYPYEDGLVKYLICCVE